MRLIRNNHNKKALAPGGGFCSAVALSIASAARKRGWQGTGAAGGAVAVAEATAGLLRSRSVEAGGRAKISAVTVAPNGFINFEADFVSSSTLVRTLGLEDVCAVISSLVHMSCTVCGTFERLLTPALNRSGYATVFFQRPASLH